MKRIALLLVSLAFVAAACAPSAPPPYPPAGCYAGSIPGGSGSIYFTGLAPTPWTPNITSYNGVADCSPAAPTAQLSAVYALSGFEAVLACQVQAGMSLPLDAVPISIYFGLVDFDNVWICHSIQPR